jgi:hypothetical protein
MTGINAPLVSVTKSLARRSKLKTPQAHHTPNAALGSNRRLAARSSAMEDPVS